MSAKADMSVGSLLRDAKRYRYLRSRPTQHQHGYRRLTVEVQDWSFNLGPEDRRPYGIWSSMTLQGAELDAEVDRHMWAKNPIRAKKRKKS